MFTRNAAIAAAMALCGCAYFAPTVDSIRYSPPTDPGPMPLLVKAVTAADGKLGEMETKRNWTYVTSALLDFATFGFGVGAAAAGLHVGHHMNSVTNLTFAAGTTYLGARLFAPIDVGKVYDNGASALSCVVSKGATVADEVAKGKILLKNDDVANVPLSLITPDGCTPDSEIDEALSDALTQKRALEKVVGDLIASDATKADVVRGAANGIIAKVMDQVISRSNSSDAIMSALKGLGVASPQIVVPTDKVQAPAGGGNRDAAVACDATSKSLLKNRFDDYKALMTGMSSAVNALATLDTACAVSATPVTALALDSEEVTVAKDGRANVNISGGREPYTLTATGTTSPNVDVTLVPPHTVVVIGRSTITGAGGPFLYQVRDNSAVSTPKTLKINTK